MALHHWESLAGDGSVRALTYSFGFGTANTLAIRRDDGSWMVISPPAGAPAEVLDALAHDGPVSALVAPNAFHHLGQRAWRTRFPEATSYAHEGSLARLAKQSRGVEYRPLGELTRQLPSNVRVWMPGGMKEPDLFASATSADGTVVFAGDLVSNMVAADIDIVPRLLFQLLGGGTGYRFNPVPAMVYLRDRPAWWASVRSALSTVQLSAVVPAHGALVQDDAHARTRAIFAASP